MFVGFRVPLLLFAIPIIGGAILGYSAGYQSGYREGCADRIPPKIRTIEPPVPLYREPQVPR